MAKDRRSRDQRRRAKLAKRRQDSPANRSLAYHGAKYRTETLTPVWLNVELGVYQAFVIADRRLVDQTVVEALETLIRQLRSQTSQPADSADSIEYKVGNEADLVMETIRQNLSTDVSPSREQLIGVLRSILGSIDVRRSPSPRSQSYVLYLEKFLVNELGVSVEEISSNEVHARMAAG